MTAASNFSVDEILNDSEEETEKDFEAEEEISEAQKEFEAAAAFVRSVLSSKSSPDDLLYLYGRYKQALDGPCDVKKPGFFDFQAKQKWTAWKNLGQMPKIEAMREYVEKVQELDPNFDPNSATDPKSQTNEFGLKISRMVEGENFSPIPENSLDPFDLIKSENFEKLKKIWDKNFLNLIDDSGLTLLHWAADRGNFEICEFLLEKGLDPNAKDFEDEQTPLHFGVFCSHFQIVKLLLKFGADPKLKNSDGKTPVEICEDEKIRRLFD